jgi:hypothetical protein
MSAPASPTAVPAPVTAVPLAHHHPHQLSRRRAQCDAGSSGTFFHNVRGSGSHQFAEAGVALLKLQKAGAVDDDTAAILLRRQSVTWSAVRVSEGAPNSGGTGYRALRVPN